MLLQVIHHCETYNLQPDYQSAYRADYSCETAILHLSNDILWAQERQSIMALVAIDLSAAFDTVDHDILLEILKNKFGIEGKALKWFDSYLRPRSFKVIINNTYSKDINLTVSVPQGSCAGANIFNLYCSPLETIVSKDIAISGFADDHSIRKSFKALDRNAENSMIDSLQKMNLSKTKFIYFGYPRQLQKCTTNSIDVAGDLILRSDVIKYLGSWLDSSLNLKQHITRKCQAAMISFFKIRNIRHLLDAAITASLCISLCLSHMDYCNSILYGLPDITINKMQRLQNMCAHLVLRRSKWQSARQCLMELHWLPICQRIEHKILTYI